MEKLNTEKRIRWIDTDEIAGVCSEVGCDIEVFCW